ncbi:MAG TPA: cation diffusion facilitator family transporter [Blastocatellia bacterium]|jgi:ferrous-iron efflux pump FieF|nr:cation diffusion facilitator family transporter [Blastocatellia bacterium]
MSRADETDRARSAHAEESRAKKRAATLSILAAAFLIALKTATGLLTGSISVWASLLDSVMDIIASTINFIAVRAAARPADEDHTYGHGKAESLGGLFQAVVIALSGLFLIVEAVARLRTPHKTNNEWVGIITMAVAIIVSLLLVRTLRRVAHETDSIALSSDAVHYVSDIFTNAGALVALAIISLTGWRIIDPLISILISLYILWSAFSIGKDAVDILMDRSLPAGVSEEIAQIVERYRDSGVRGFHDLRSRRSGSHKFIDLHLEIERTKSLEEAHALTVRVLREIEATIPRSRVHIHTDPS